jgi:hypothetical protein
MLLRAKVNFKIIKKYALGNFLRYFGLSPVLCDECRSKGAFIGEKKSTE